MLPRKILMLKMNNMKRKLHEAANLQHGQLLENLLQDARYGLRVLCKSPSFTFVAILVLSLGIGGSIAVFSLVNAVLLRTLPYGSSSRLVYLFTPNSRFNMPAELFSPTYADFFDLRQQCRSFSDMTLVIQQSYSLSAGNIVERTGGARVDSDFFSTLQSSPEIGHGIGPDDDEPGHANVVVISHALWESIFGRDPNVLSSSLLLDGHPYRIIGVMPRAFHYPNNSDLAYGDPSIRSTQLWVPLALSPKEKADRNDSNGYAIARLSPGTTIPQAQTEMSTVMSRLDHLHAGYLIGSGALVKSFDDAAVGSSRSMLWLLSGAVLLLLGVACGNAASLLLAKASTRAHELAIRAALGAERGRVIRQLLTESLILGLAAGIVGVGLAYLLMHILVRLDPGDIPRLGEISLNAPVMFFSLLITLLTSMSFGIMPAWSVSRINIAKALRTDSTVGIVGARRRTRGVLMIGQVFFLVLLLTGTGLLLRSYAKIESIKTGFAPSTIAVRLQLDDRYSKKEQRIAFFTNLMQKISTIPGVHSVGAVKNLPLSKTDTMISFWVDGYANQKDQIVEWNAATPDYFSSMDIPLIKGRFFAAADSIGHRPVAVIDHVFAIRYFGNRDPIGQTIGAGGGKGPRYTVVGVVGDVRRSALQSPPEPQVYSYWNLGADNAYITIQSELPPGSLAAEVRSSLKAVDPSLALADFHSMADLVSTATARRHFQTTLLTIFAVVALILAMVGIYGLLAYSVRQRTAEIGVRMAVGASRVQIIGMIVREGLQLVAGGLVFGIIAALLLTRFLSSFLYEIDPLDPLTFITIPILFFSVAAAAALIPGLRAMAVEPISALRSE
jgi:predicted permease